MRSCFKNREIFQVFLSIEELAYLKIMQSNGETGTHKKDAELS